MTLLPESLTVLTPGGEPAPAAPFRRVDPRSPDPPDIGPRAKPRKALRYWIDGNHEARLKIHFCGVPGEHLTSESTFHEWQLEDLVDALERYCASSWVQILRSRYLDFSRVERACTEWRQQAMHDSDPQVPASREPRQRRKHRRNEMSRQGVRVDVLEEVIAGLQSPFTTKEVSRDERMRLAHPELVGHSHYHAFVGGALSENHYALGIRMLEGDTPDGARWEKRAGEAGS